MELEKIVFDWPNYWEQNQAPSFQVVVRSVAPLLPSYKQVQNIQDTINSRLAGQFPGLELQMQVLEDEPKNEAGDSTCLLYTSPSPRDGLLSRMPSSA